jgi:hypothetical protein
VGLIPTTGTTPFSSNAFLAQLVVRSPRKGEVISSSLIEGTILHSLHPVISWDMRKTVVITLDVLIKSLIRHYGEETVMSLMDKESEGDYLNDRVRKAFRLDIPVRSITRRNKDIDFEFKFANIDDAALFRLKWL